MKAENTKETTMTHTNPLIKNPHLKGGPFYWGAGPTGILLVHGFTATTAEVRPLAEALHANNYTVAGPVLPGHNTYPEDINNYTWRNWVSTVETAYQELVARCERVYVGGESTGGLLALYLAAQHAEIAGVLTYAPALKLQLKPIDHLKLRLSAPFISYLPKGGEDDNLPWKGYTVNPLKGVVQLLKFQKQVLSRLLLIRCPLLIVQGKLDNTVDPDVPQMIYDRVSSAVKEVHWMENSSHCVAIDCEREQVAEITLEFLTKANQS
jgi:carboxylesterase